VEERFPGELETLRADNVRLRRLLKLSDEQARAADPDQAALTGAPTTPVDIAHNVWSPSGPMTGARVCVAAYRLQRPGSMSTGWP
jgi:hypothetical protein